METLELHNLIHDNTLLQQVSNDALKSVTEQHPWYALPYVLLAKKAFLEQDPQYEYWLAAAAARVPDRNVLMQIMQGDNKVAEAEGWESQAPEPAQEAAEINLAEMEEPLREEEQHNHQQEAEQEDPVFEYAPYEMELQKAILDLEKSGKGAALPNFPVEPAEKMTAGADSQLSMHTDGMHSFSEWLHLLTGDSMVQLVPYSSARRPLKVSSKAMLVHQDGADAEDAAEDFTEWEAKELARKSSQLGEGVISETLASIFVQQGKPEKAIEIYKQLGLKYPEKISYFAGLILDINKK